MPLKPQLPGVVDDLRAIVGSRSVITKKSRARRFTTGYRYGEGSVLAVVRPANLVELWRVLKACVNAGVIVIIQSANTGLTGGSTPDGSYDREVVLINTLRIKGIHPIDGGQQVLCMPGSTLFELESVLKPFDREPHSVIGSSCIGASVLGGVCNNSGGALVQRGPAYTELALFAQVDAQGRLQLVNHLGIRLGDGPEEILRRVEKGDFSSNDVSTDEVRHASDHRYCEHVRQVEEPTPARFNADPSRLYEASGSAGKVAVLAVRLDTFPAETDTQTFYIGTNNTAELARIRRDILKDFECLPVAGEYMHREAFDLAARYGKDTVIAIERLGTARLPRLFGAKARLDAWMRKAPGGLRHASDSFMQAAGRCFGDHLPTRLRAFRDKFEHHLILKMGGNGVAEAQAYLERAFPSADGDFFACSQKEAAKAFLHRFAVAGAAIRYRAIHHRTVEDIIALDIALRRNDRDWFEMLPDSITDKLVHKLYYGHFFCHVFHQDYIVRKGADPLALEREMLEILDRRGAEYPAEHNVGHLYAAKPDLANHYRALDPSNMFNPGIGGTARGANWKN
ncbi:D-lactate dehydrogenase [Novosphingobium sp. PP1Y]|uniref:D-lactate dehydrogenase n=1 Tax=Novosphingobium sp. PP1Y TaxID=702113 RepID=UPI00020EF36F|nr:D-lactate dehydrogenase [Novosphingobium sp. PP1Y]CCA94018.1 D-lactate dehydrogenase [Novosphingobium sp. PP1Y]